MAGCSRPKALSPRGYSPVGPPPQFLHAQDRIPESELARRACTPPACLRAGRARQAGLAAPRGGGRDCASPSSGTAFKRYPHVLENRRVIHLGSETGDVFEQAYGFAQKQVRKLIEKHPGVYPLHTQNGKWEHEGPAWTHWGDGFLPGMMWIFHKHSAPNSSEANFWLEQAIRYTTPLEPRKHDKDVHDLGFLFFSTYYRWWR